MSEQFEVWQVMMAAALDAVYDDDLIRVRLGSKTTWNDSTWSRLASAPIQADLSSDIDSHVLIGIGLSVTANPQQPPTYLGHIRSHVYTAAFTVHVRGDSGAPYETLLHVIELLAIRFGGHLGRMSYKEDPHTASSETHTLSMDIVDEGDGGQDIDDNGDYVAVRGFTVTVL